jgi:hypothetical protein
MTFVIFAENKTDMKNRLFAEAVKARRMVLPLNGVTP